MARILVLTTDLPYFPGKMGVDFFNLRHLAEFHEVAVVGPWYDIFPAEGVANLESFLCDSYFWPRPVDDAPLLAAFTYSGRLNPRVMRIPGRFRWWFLKRLLRIEHRPADAFDKLAILANCGPQLLRAIHDGPWHAMVLIQTNIEPWLDYLPRSSAKMVYFHDVRSDYFKRVVLMPGESPRPEKEVRTVFEQERRLTETVDMAAFVSKLDRERAIRMFSPVCETGVAPIAVDTTYYTPRPTDWARDPRPLVLFTGHMGHPPNADAVLYFLAEIWPLILEKRPDAVFQAVGMSPAQSVIEAIANAPSSELHANVPDIRPYFWNASTYIVPMRYGGGVRQKILEAWSMQVPVVCTTMAAEGTDAVSGQHCWLEDSPNAFAGRVVSSLDQAHGCTTVQAGKRHVEALNSIRAAAPEFRKLVERSIRSRGRKPYRLLFDLRWMEIGKAGGIEQATYELVAAIGNLDRRNAYRLFAPRSTLSEWDFPSGFQVDRHVSDPVAGQLEAARAFVANKLAEGFSMYPVLTPEMRSLSRYRQLDFDLVHSVAGYTHPDMLGFPGVLTINDLQHLHYPEFFTPHEVEERERLYRQSAERAHHIICISEFTRQDVHRQYGVPLEKMSTVWIIPSRNVWQPLPAPARTRLLAGMGLAGDFFFFPAHCWPHKNHVRLLSAFERVVDELPPGMRLVMTGRPFPEDHPARSLLREGRLASSVVHLGFRSPLEMRALFQGCTALVFPSLFEGFGMPVAEAIIAGKPVLCSNVTSLPELAGDAALSFDPHNVQDIAQALLAVATNADIRRTLADKAVRRRGLFGAHRAAVQTMAIHQRVYDDLH